MTTLKARRWASTIAGVVLTTAVKEELSGRIAADTGDTRAAIRSDLDGLSAGGATADAIVTAFTT